MPSEESRRIRATLIKAVETTNTPLEIQRQTWETEASQTRLPTGTTLTPLSANGVPCEYVSNPEADPARVVIHLHGGGFNSGSCRTHRDLAARLSLAVRAPVLLVDYRLAPEHPFPAAVEDVVKVYRWLLADGKEPSRMAMSGDSAGGGLVISGLLSLRDGQELLPGAAVLLSPWLDLTLTGETMTSRAGLDPIVSLAGLRTAAQYYLGDRDPTTPLASPIYADLSGLPPLLIQVGDHELLLSDSLRLADRAKAAGVEVQLEVWPEMWHVWHSWAASLPEAQEALHRIGDFVRERLA
jgi:acetyl esterase/lipase